MGRAVPAAEQPTYEQLEEMIRRKDNLVSGLYLNMEGLRAAAWLAHHAHDSGQLGYSEDEYVGAASHLFRFIAVHAREVQDDFREAHRGVSRAVLAGQPEEGASHG
ncbi:MAG: hypothetical protein PGN34_18320 [Methylobacterium frigidaeris]